MEMKSDTSNIPQESGNEKPAIRECERETENGGVVSGAELHEQSNQLGVVGIKEETSPHKILKLNLENSGEEAVVEKATEDYTDITAVEGKTVDIVTSSNIAKFGENDNISPSAREMETEFLRLSLGFKCDLFTLDKRFRLEERSRDLAEENLKREISNCLKLLETLVPVCEEDNQSREIIKKLEKSLQFLSQHTACVASRAEMLGAIHQESRVSKAVDVMIQHVENLKRMYATEHAELEELKIILKTETSFSALLDEDESLSKKLASSKSLRKGSIISFPAGARGSLTGLPLSQLPEMSVEKSDTCPRRSSNWRGVASENRPSLQRLISTSPWADAEEYCMKGNEQGLLNEVKAKKCFMEGNKLKPNTQVNSMSSWMTHFRTSFTKANKTLWASVIAVMFLAVLGSFIAGMCFQRPADAAPVGIGVSWTSLQQLLWPYTGLRHNAQPPV